MPHLEPTYLRYIYDGLLKGSIHPENAAELPEGLIGLYEEALDERNSVVERQKLLERFAIWALLKKEVSAGFVAEVLGETEDDIHEFISTYSAWFNSPESGKYQLYHERLKVYLLQKLSEGEIQALHEKLIVRLEKAIQEQKADDFEWYGLEFLAGHYGANAMLIGDGSKLLALAYDQIHWQRQLKISKGFNWTKTGLKAVMTWASKYNDDQVIECGLQLVDLHHQEQNAAPQIVALVAEGDFDSALKRIEDFGSNDKEGLQRKFILYMLCFLELTLLDNKDKLFRKEGLEKLLKHLDEQLPVHHSDLDWNEFLPDLLIKELIYFLFTNNIDHTVLLKFSKVEIDSNNLCNNLHAKKKSCDYKYRNEVILSSLENLSTCITLVLEEDIKIDIEEIARNCFEMILNHLSKDEFDEANLKINYALYYSDKIPADDIWGSYGNHLKGEFVSDLLGIGFHKIAIQVYMLMEKGEGWSDSALKDISNKLLLKGDVINLELIYFLTRKDGFSHFADHTFKCLVEYYYSNGRLYEIKATLLKHLKSDRKLIDGFKQLSFFNGLIYSNPQLKTFKLLIASDINKMSVEGYRLIESIIDNYSSKHSLLNLGNDLIEVIDLINSQELKAVLVSKYVKDIIHLNKGIFYILKNGSFREDFQIESYFENIFIEICGFIAFDEAIDLISEIDNEGTCRYDAAKGVLKAYIGSKQIEDLKGPINYHDIFQKIIAKCTDEKSKDRMISNLLYVLLQHSLFEEVQFFIGLLNDNKIKYDVLSDLFKKLDKQKNINEFENIIYEMLQCAQLISEESFKCTALKEVSYTMYKLGDFEEASSVLHDALESARRISDVSKKSCSLHDIAEEQIRQGWPEEAVTVKNEALKAAMSIQDESKKNSSAVFEISLKLMRQGNIDEAFGYSQFISSDNYKNELLRFIAGEYAKLGIFEKAFYCVKDINGSDIQSQTLKNISDEFIKHSKIDKAYECALRIGDDYWKSAALQNISVELASQGNVEEATSVMRDALEHARGIIDDYKKSKTLASISMRFSKQYRFKEALESLIGLNDSRMKNNAIIELLIILNKQVEINQIESIGNEITNSSLRNYYFNELSKYLVKNSKNINSLKQFEKFESPELKKWFLKNWIDNIEISEVSMVVAQQFIYLSKDQIELIEILLQYYVLNFMFFRGLDKDKLKRYNQTLNIQWAIDIKNQFPN